MLSQKQILFGNKMLQEVAISWDVPILKAARILAGKEINEFWKWINADEFLNFKLKDHLVYRRKQIEFVPEYYSGLNCKDAKHLIGKVVEGTNYPNEDWKTMKLLNITNGKQRYGVFEVYHQKEPGVIGTYEYIRTVEEILVPEHPTINICGVELPKPETVDPALGTKYWLTPACNERVWHGYHYNISALKEGRVHLTEERAKAWADWWKTAVIDKMK